MNQETIVCELGGSAKFTRLRVLSQEDAMYWRNIVWENQRNWIPRMRASDNSQPMFYTIGRAIYLDVCQSENIKSDYYDSLLINNEIIINKFGPLLDIVRNTLEDYLQEPIVFSNDLALPGFHIFFKNGIEMASQVEPHFDMQYMRVNWGAPWDSGKCISFTIPLYLPKCGSGLEVWYDSQADLSHSQETETRQSDSFVEDYQCGILYLQEGMIRHRIAQINTCAQFDERITIQGHGLRFAGTWVLYW